MEQTNIKVLSNEEIQELAGKKDLVRLELSKSYEHNLKTNLIVPSVNQAYSCCIEYMRAWFFDKFGDKFFKTQWLDSEHMLNPFRRRRTKDLVVVNKPAVVITPELDMNFNRENIDLHNMGMLLYTNRCTYKDAWFVDRDKSLFISMTMEMLMMNFNYRMKFNGRGIQLDIAKMCQMAFRAGGTQKHYNDIDYPLPKELMNQLADDALGICIKDGDILNVTRFLHYVNSHSRLPVLYKFNAATHNMEYFLKVPQTIIHIKTNDISVDSGSDIGMAKSDYGVSFDTNVRFPTPKFYAYYSLKLRDNIQCTTLDKASALTSLMNASRIPPHNEKGWQWNIKSEYEFTDEKEVQDIKDGKLMKIKFDGLIGDLRDIIDYTKSIAISPEVFLDIKIYNSFEFVDTEIDWMNFEIKFKQPLKSTMCYFIIYIDNNYLNEHLTQLRRYMDQRVNPSHNEIGPELSHDTKTMIY